MLMVLLLFYEQHLLSLFCIYAQHLTTKKFVELFISMDFNHINYHINEHFVAESYRHKRALRFLL